MKAGTARIQNIFLVTLFSTIIFAAIAGNNEAVTYNQIRDLAGVTEEDPEQQRTWITLYGESGDDFAHSAKLASDEGYIISGETKSFGADSAGNAFLAKIALNGSMLWLSHWGGEGEERGYYVNNATDGYIVTGWSDSSFTIGKADLWLIKTDFNGTQEWNRTYGGTEDDWGESVAQTDDGGFIVAGFTNSSGAGSYDFYLVKTDSSGNLLWNKTFGSWKNDWAFSVDITADKGYIVCGWTGIYWGASDNDFYLVKTYENGSMIWENTYGGDELETCIGVAQTPDGGYIAVGHTESYGAGGSDVYLVKTDSAGNMLWNKTYGGPGMERGYSLEQTQDGGYIITGWTESFGRGRDVYLIKTDADGNMTWNKTFGGDNLDRGYAVVLAKDGGY